MVKEAQIKQTKPKPTSPFLTDEDKFYLGMDLTKGGGEKANLYELIDKVSQATVEKVRKWGNGPCPHQIEAFKQAGVSIKPSDLARPTRKRDCDECWSILEKGETNDRTD